MKGIPYQGTLESSTGNTVNDDSKSLEETSNKVKMVLVNYKNFKPHSMMHHSEQYQIWGMHAGWWILVLVLGVALVGLSMQLRKRK
jgi:hypothetical protein